MLSRGQRIKVIVEELQPQNQMIVSFEGRLFRVFNSSGRPFQKGDVVLLLVVQTDPVELSLSPEKNFIRMG
jgi:hypothetical protein